MLGHDVKHRAGQLVLPVNFIGSNTNGFFIQRFDLDQTLHRSLKRPGKMLGIFDRIKAPGDVLRGDRLPVTPVSARIDVKCELLLVFGNFPSISNPRPKGESHIINGEQLLEHETENLAGKNVVFDLVIKTFRKLRGIHRDLSTRFSKL